MKDTYDFLGGKKVKAKKEALLSQLIESFFNIKWSCKQVDISRRTYELWRQKDPEFDRACFDEMEGLKDEAEVLMQKRMREKSDAILIFWAKTKMKDRGYVEKKEFEHSGTFSTLTKEEKEAEIKRLLEK